MAVRQRKQRVPLVQSEDPAGGIAGRADINELRVSPVALAERAEGHPEVVTLDLVEERGLCSRQERRPLVDLIERVRAYDQPAGPTRMSRSARMEREF